MGGKRLFIAGQCGVAWLAAAAAEEGSPRHKTNKDKARLGSP